MTAAEFLAFYPQFESVIPGPVLSAFVESAGLRFSDFHEDAEEARRLYVAHKLTLYARTVPAGSSSAGGDFSARMAALASSGDSARTVSKRVDDVAVTYSAGASASAASGSLLSELRETAFGIQLLSLLRLYACPRYVP